MLCCHRPRYSFRESKLLLENLGAILFKPQKLRYTKDHRVS
jgi:hypothetical protein